MDFDGLIEKSMAGATAARGAMIENPGWVMAGACLVIAICLLSAFSTYRRSQTVPLPGPLPMYFTDDDGATFFVEDTNKLPPFDHNGKTAVLAMRYRCDGHTWVQFLEKFENLPLPPVKGSTTPQIRNTPITLPCGMVKRPGDKDWVRVGTPESSKIMTPKAPGGVTGDIQPLLP